MIRQPPPSLAEAVGHHQAGRLDEAERIYRDVLRRNPHQADALHLLGALHLQRGDPDKAIGLIARALRHDPDNATFHVNLATALLEKGETGKAIQHYRKALAIQPGHVDAHYNIANALRRHGHAEEAAGHYRRAIEIAPDHVPARNNLALCLAEQGAVDEAVATLEEALRAAADDPETHGNLALVLQSAGRLDEALARYDEALRRAPRDPDILNNRGTALAHAGRTAEAERDYRAALALAPDFAEAHLNIGNLRRADERYAEAEAAYRQAIACDPAYEAAYANLATVLTATGRYADAESALRKALEIRPDYPAAYNNLAHAMKTAGRMAEARAAFDQALRIAPDYVEARYGRAFVNLLTGRYSQGWSDYLARPSVRGAAGRYHRTPLAGGLAGRRVLVEGDQGLGDEIFFLRFVPALAARGAAVAYRPDPRLAAMLERAGIARIVGDAAEAEDFDLVLSAGDLPFLVGMGDGDAVPPSIRLAPLGERTAALRERLNAFGPGPHVGVTWRGGTKGQEGALFKEAPLADLAAVLAPRGATVVALQRNPEAGEVAALAAALGRAVLDLTALNADLEDMLALLGLLDEYVCVSNTNVHLRAATGRASRVLIPNPPEFRWMAAGDESPWFPGTAVYRQKPDGDWSAALAALARDLVNGS